MLEIYARAMSSSSTESNLQIEITTLVFQDPVFIFSTKSCVSVRELNSTVRCVKYCSLPTGLVGSAQSHALQTTDMLPTSRQSNRVGSEGKVHSIKNYIYCQTVSITQFVYTNKSA